MRNMEWKIRPIGLIRSPYTDEEETPIQSAFSEGRGEIEVFPEYEAGLKDIDGFSHLILLYYFHQVKGYSLSVKPFLDDTPRGLFATRYPARPNPIGLSVVRLLERRGNVLQIGEVDVLDGTPLLDIKPYVPHFDERKGATVGWLQDRL